PLAAARAPTVEMKPPAASTARPIDLGPTMGLPANTAAAEAAYGVAAVASPAIQPAKPDASISLDPKSAEKGVARLVLTLVEFVRQLLERQAIRRMDGGLLDEGTIERMGEALARIEAKV